MNEAQTGYFLSFNGLVTHVTDTLFSLLSLGAEEQTRANLLFICFSPLSLQERRVFPMLVFLCGCIPTNCVLLIRQEIPTQTTVF